MHHWLIGLLAALRDSLVIDIKQLCVEKQEAIAAKDLLWEACSVELAELGQQKQGRKNTPARDEATAHCEDVLSWLKALDGAQKLPPIAVPFCDLVRVSAIIARVLPDQSKPTPAPVDTERHSDILSKLEVLKGLVQTAAVRPEVRPESQRVVVRNSYTQTHTVKVRECGVGVAIAGSFPLNSQSAGDRSGSGTTAVDRCTTVPAPDSVTVGITHSDNLERRLIVQGLKVAPLLDHVLSLCLGEDASKHISFSQILSPKSILVEFKHKQFVNTILLNKSNLRSHTEFFNTYIRPYQPKLSHSTPDTRAVRLGGSPSKRSTQDKQASAQRVGVTSGPVTAGQSKSSRVASSSAGHVTGAINRSNLRVISTSHPECRPSGPAQGTEEVWAHTRSGKIGQVHECVPSGADQSFVRPRRSATVRPLTVGQFLRGTIFEAPDNFSIISNIINASPTSALHRTDFVSSIEEFPHISEIETRRLVPGRRTAPVPSAPPQSVVLSDQIDLSNPFESLATVED